MLVLLLACTGTDKPIDTNVASVVDGLDVELASVPTVLRVRWTTEEATRATVTGVFGPDTVTVTETADVTDHEVFLIGFPALTEVTVTVATEGVAGAEGEGTAAITTGSLPDWVPDLAYTATVPESAAGGYAITSAIDMDGGGPLVIDGKGRPVWAQDRLGAMDGAITRTRLSRDGTALLYIGQAYSMEDNGTITRAPLDGSEPTVLEIPAVHTDFVELPTGGYAVLGWDLRMYGDRKILGTRIVYVAEDGTTETAWSVFDDYEPDLDRYYGHWYTADETIEDWSHVNGLFYDPIDDDFYVTMTFNDGVAKIDRETGHAVWTISDTDGDFANDGEAVPLAQPHSVERTDQGVLIFNRGFPDRPDQCSHATDVALDTTAGTMRMTSNYTSETCLLVTFLGSASRLANGNTLVSFTTSGQVDEVTPEGELAWRVSASLGAGFGFALHTDHLGPTE